MSKADKAGEPSMDEILASIRKIIAEEPVGARKAALPAQPAVATTSASRTDAAPKVTLDDVLGLADGAPRAQAATGGDAKPPSDVPSWLFPSPARAAPAPEKPAAVREPSKPFFPAPGPSGAATTHGAEGDLGAIVPRRAEEAGDLRSGAATERRPQSGQSGRVPEWLARPGAVGGQAMSQPLPPPAEPTRVTQRDTLASAAATPVSPEPALARGNDLSGFAETVRSASMPTMATDPVAKPAVTAKAPAASEASQGETKPDAVDALGSSPANAAPVSAERLERAALATESEKKASAAVSATAAPEAAAAAAVATSPIASSAASTPKTTHPNGGADRIIAPQATSIPVAQPVAAPATAKKDKPITVVDTPVPVAKPAVLAERPKAAKPAVAADLVPTMPQAAGVRTLEDTVVDLLRPMIRQWLDDNMPRMVEKALRIELAQSVKPRLDPARQEQPKH